MQRFLWGVAACLLLLTMSAGAAPPDQLYQTWQKNYLNDPEVAEKAARDYLRQAPQGPQAHDLQIWLDAYHKALAAILSQPKTAGQSAPASKLASAQPAPPSPQPAPGLAPEPAQSAPPSQRAARNAQPETAAVEQPAAPPKPRKDHHTQVYRVLADAYHRAMARLSLIGKPGAPAGNRASAQSAPPPKPPAVPPIRQAALPPLPPLQPAPPVQAAPPPPPEVQPSPRPGRPAQLASAIPQHNGARKNQPPMQAPVHSPVSSPASETVDDALAYIADKIESEDRLSFTAEFHNSSGGALVEQLIYLASNVTIDPNRCQVSYRWHVQQDGRPTTDQDRAVQLRFAKSISVVTIDQALDELNARRFTARVYPEAWAVHIARWDKPTADNLYFHDKGMADSIAEAAQHALDLCDKKADRFGR